MSKSQSVEPRKKSAPAASYRAVAIKEVVIRRLKKIGSKHNPKLSIPATIEYCVGLAEGSAQ